MYAPVKINFASPDLISIFIELPALISPTTLKHSILFKSFFNITTPSIDDVSYRGELNLAL